MPDFNFKPKVSSEEYGWHHRNLPHFDDECQTQFVTFRLCDSLPQALVEKWRAEGLGDVQFRKRVERFLDRGVGECWLGIPAVAEVLRDAILFHSATKYDLHAWVVMPNHGHISITPRPNVHLPDVLHSIKSYTAQMCNKVLGRSGEFWQHESFDRYIRNSRHFHAVTRYIERNPVKAGLCEEPSDWQWSSAYRERDGNGGAS